MRETITRTLSGLVYIIVLTAAIFYSPFTFLLLFGIFLIIAVTEFCGLQHFNIALPIFIAAAAYILFVAFPTTFITSILLTAAALFVSVRCMIFLFGNHGQNADTSYKYVLLVGYIIIPFILLTKIPYTETGYRPEILVSLLILFWANDTFAFVFGKTMGRHKLFERISPKKTIEGFVGGLVFSVVAGSVIALYYVHQPVYIWIITALIVSFIGTIGDLVESKFKRVAMVKDSGKIMPGHGGILDRLDSVIFASPFVFLFFQIINYVS
ncbi:MAG TPA: phosphatidate cytidylyltransferase [Flavobacterium sp.]|jgi:phosphatidate cytidylyltransferase